MHGTRGGLSLVLKFPNDERPLSTTLHSTFLEMGFKVLVHNNIEFPNEETVGKLTPVNREYYVSVRPTQTICSDQVRQLTIEDRQCVFSEERPSPFFERYSRVSHFLDFFFKSVFSPINVIKTSKEIWLVLVENVCPLRVWSFFLFHHFTQIQFIYLTNLSTRN